MSISAENEISLDKTPAFTYSLSDRTAEEQISKLQPRTVDQFIVVHETDDTVTLEHAVIRETVSIDRLTQTPTPDVIIIPHEALADVRTDVENMDEHQPPLIGEVPGQTISLDKCDELTKAHFIDQILSHHLDSQKYKYSVRWYGYGTADDTKKSSEHLPCNYIACSWRRKTSNLTPLIPLPTT